LVRKGPLKVTWSNTLCSEQGHLQLDQAAQSPVTLHTCTQPSTFPHCCWGTCIALLLANTQCDLVARNTLVANILSPRHSQTTLNSASWSG